MSADRAKSSCVNCRSVLVTKASASPSDSMIAVLVLGARPSAQAATTSDWLTRQGDPKAGPIASPKVLEAIFSAESMKHRYATEAIEVAPGNVLVARVADLKPTEERSLEAVRGEITARLTQREAARLAHEAGEDLLLSCAGRRELGGVCRCGGHG